MISDGLWRAKRQRDTRAHPRRLRRPRFGEMIQVDGSDHDWFEGRGPRCTLIVFIDDATSALMYLRFVPSETTWAYLNALRRYIAEYGRPVSLYSDRHSIFRVNGEQKSVTPTGLTQFGRVLNALGIEPIHANSPQAKGRVERANGTLQDRLVKEMRLAGIGDIDAANAFLETYRDVYNARFAVAPWDPLDAHRPVPHSADELDVIFTVQHQRIVTNNLEVHYDKRTYQLVVSRPAYALRRAKVTVCERECGAITVLHRGRHHRCQRARCQAARIAKAPCAAARSRARPPLAANGAQATARSTPLIRGHFYFAQKGTFLLWIDSRNTRL
jgi:hypothetical protein